MSKSVLATRHVYPERSGILVDHIGHGDVSSWARGTSKPFGSQFKPVRPNENAKLTRDSFTPVRSLRACAQSRDALDSVAAKPKPHDPSSVILPDKGKFDWEERSEKVNKRTIAIANKFEELYRKAAEKTIKAPTVPLAPVVDPLADCRRTRRDVIERLKANTLPRE
jgi:hypothetical protein